MLDESISSKFLRVKLIIFDVDGVLTDGKKSFGVNGEKLSKSFGDLDFSAIKIMKNLGFKIIWLSGDEIVNQPVAELKGIPFYCTRQKDGTNVDKVTLLPEILKEYHLSKEEIWFVGDDIFDLNIIRIVGISSCPANASFLVRREVTLVHTNNSGENIASEVLELLFNIHNLKEIDINAILINQNENARKTKP